MLSNNDKDLANRDKAMTTDAIYAQNLFREAFPEMRHGSVKAAIYAGYRFIARHVSKDFTERRARSIHEGTARRIDAEEIDALKIALIEESRREQRDLRSRLASLDEKIAAFEAASDRQAVASARREMGRAC